jgi:hypothetical protein
MRTLPAKLSPFGLRSALAGILLAAGCATAPSATTSSSSSQDTSGVTSTSLSYETLVDMVQTRHLRSVDDLLGQPELDRSFMRGFTSVFRSQSIQHADPQNPRIILYGTDAKLILAFTCAGGDCAGQSSPVLGGDRLEIIQWRDASKSFELRDITFPEGPTGDATFSEANPARCLACHEASDPRPNFEPYNQWPGMYGGMDDGAQPGRLVDGESRDDLDRFLQNAQQRPRYRRLTEIVSGYQYIYDYGGVHEVEARTDKTHNIDFNEAVYLLNDARITDRIQKLPFYADIKHALRLALSDNPFSEPLRAIGQGDLAALADQCATASEPASRVVQLLHGLGVDSLPWFLSFGASPKSELRAPSLRVESQLENALDAADPDLQADHDELEQKAEAGWTRLLAAHPVHDTLAACAAGR